MGSLFIDSLHDYGVRAFDNLDTPQMSTPVVVGTPGTTTYEYVATFKTKVGETIASSSVSVATGPATLNDTDKILLDVQTIPAGAKFIRYFKKVDTVWDLIGEVAVATHLLYDTGQTPSATVHPPTADTSGRPNWYAPLFKAGRYLQRMELIDLESIIHQRFQDFGDITHRDGDIINGLKESFISGTTWKFTAGMVYVDGIYIRIPEGQVELVGTGKEKVGIVVAVSPITYNDDAMLRNLDEEVPLDNNAYEAPGADQLSFDITWAVDDPNQIPIKDFIDNQPMLQTFRPERTELDRTVARRTFDISGNCVVRNFPLQVVDHPTDTTKLILKVGPGKAYPNGYEVETLGTQSIPFNKARDVKAVNNSGTSGFSIPGGSVVTSNPENYDVDGLKVSLTIGSGNVHEVTFTGNGQTAAQVGTAIEAALNAYPTDGELIICTAAGGYLEIQAIDGKNLTVNAVTGDAYTILGISTGTYTPVGTRIYECNDNFIKDVSDLSYKTLVGAEQKTHNGTTHKDLLSNANVLDILGASTTAADAHDGKYDYLLGVDFGKDGDYIDFGAYGGADPPAGGTYYVAYTYNRNATKGARVLVQVVDATITKGAVGGTDGLVFTGGTFTKVIDGSTVTGLTGNASDVVQILRVNNSPSQSQTEYNAYLFHKNSDGLAHAQSTIDWSRATAPGSGIGGQPALSATYYVSYLVLQHATEGDFLSADSYDMYDRIETFATLNLRDCIDFRTLGTWPVPGENPTLDYNFYLSRRDKLILADTGDFSLVAGTPGNPAPIPPEQSNTLSLAVLFIDPYTYTALEAKPVSLEPMRITQTGLRRLADRIRMLEYWNVVSSLEKEVANTPVLGETKGLSTDALTGLGRVDTAFDKVDRDGNRVRHTAAIDRLTRTLRLPATTQPKTLSVDLVNSTHVRASGGIVCLDYQPEVFNQQLQAAITVGCAPDYEFEDYVGVMKLNPVCDSFLDETQLPQINVDYDDQVTSASQNMDPETFWGAWENKGAAVVSAAGGNVDGGMVQVFSSSTQTQERSGLQLENVPGSIVVDMGNQIVDMSVIPMLRTLDSDGNPFVIYVDVLGLVPNQDHGVSIGGTQVDFVYDSGADHPRGQQGSNTVAGKTTVTSDNSGRLTGKFTMPAGIPNGSPLVVCSHWQLPTHSVALTAFYGKGFMANRQETTIGIPNPSIRLQTITQTQEIVTESVMEVAIGSGGTDPIAQTFLIPPQTTYISAVGLHFAAKSATLPITIQIRNTVNGQPGASVFASTTLEPDEVSVSNDSSAETICTFDHVLGYLPGNEYCFAVVPGSATTDYRVWAAELGAIDIQSGEIIGPPMADGVYYHSPNGRAWEGDTKKDIKYKIYKSNFENNCQIVFQAISGLQAAQIALAVEEFVAPGTNVLWSYRLNGTGDWIPFHPRVDVILEQIVTQVQLRVDVTSLGGSYQIVSNIMGVLFLLHVPSADYIGFNKFFADPLDLPNKITCTFKTNADGVDGPVTGGTSVKPQYTVDDGEYWCQIQPTPGYVPTGAEEAFYVYEFTTPDEASITNATNASPIVITSAAHGYQNNELVNIAGIVGNTAANRISRVKNRTDNTFELIDPTTGANIAGNGAWESGGTINLAEFSQMRGRITLETDNQARTPEDRDIGFLCSKV